MNMPLFWNSGGIPIGVMLTVRRFAPSLHNVAENPLQELLRSPRDAWLFALVVVVAGGVREEIQRAFLLHRFDIWLGGGVVSGVLFMLVEGLKYGIELWFHR